jgi:hypothetical protein
LLVTDYLAGAAGTAVVSVAGAASAAGAASSAAGAVSSVAAGSSAFGALLHDTKANVATVTKAKNTFFILLFVFEILVKKDVRR